MIDMCDKEDSEELDALAAVFPQLERPTLAAALAAHDGRLDAAVDALLAAEDHHAVAHDAAADARREQERRDEELALALQQQLAYELESDDERNVTYPGATAAAGQPMRGRPARDRARAVDEPPVEEPLLESVGAAITSAAASAYSFATNLLDWAAGSGESELRASRDPPAGQAPAGLGAVREPSVDSACPSIGGVVGTASSGVRRRRAPQGPAAD